ncbi:hypothetical protein SVR5_00691 [Glaesserella parasuis 29755]|uniref:hypothetical protein n=1 Tax=Glaesserella parasuis TaxID=738 RepID=UPI000165B26B|nr:hypothetical protein [Glaesserella parasuis]EQA95913.1 hypothetical protein HPS_0533 [Glaesserella parasuis 29755]CDH99238.1 hypothetical protein SVR5_00691 [Glaesserella parasuis 29755]
MNLPDDYFLDVDDEMLEYLEKQALQSYDDVKKIKRKQSRKSLPPIKLSAFGYWFYLITANKQH